MKRGHLRLLAVLVLTLALLSGCGRSKDDGTNAAGMGGEEPAAAGETENITAFRAKAEALRSAALAGWVREELGERPAGEAGHAVFLSLCSGLERARVYGGTGETPDAAWDAAVAAAESALRGGSCPAPRWVKADLVCISETIPADWLLNIGGTFGRGSFRYGLALDPDYQTAFLEAELNCAGVYDYENGGVDLERLNGYLAESGRGTLQALPDEYTAFQCAGWFCDESGSVCQLSLDEPDYGRREMSAVSGDTARALVLDGAEYLAGQVGADGTVSAGGERLRAAGHAEVLSAMIRGYALQPGEALAESIDRAAGWLLAGTAYADSGLAFVPDGGEITLESCALSLIALADCMEASGDTAYLPACQALGAGILSLLDTETGAFTHVLDAETLSRTEAFCSAAWDGMGVTALCRLYGLTEDALWLWAARLALEHMIAEDYTQYGEAWTACAVREMTRYDRSRADYFAFALKNAQRSLPAICQAETAFPAGLELLTASYESYRQMLDAGYSAGGFALELTLEAIRQRAVRQLDGYLFPEYAMYMDAPQEVLGAFMTREEGLRVLPGDVCRNIRGYALYAANYDALLAGGMSGSE